MSLYQQRQRTFAAELAHARTEREQFTATLVARFGKEAAHAIRHNAWRMEDMILGGGGMPKPSPERSIAAIKLWTFDRKVIAVRKKICRPDCSFSESPGAVSVLQAAGLSWRMVQEKCSADGCLPISGSLWLLQALRKTDQGVPTEKQARQPAATGLGACQLPEKWQQRLRRRRRRLALLLRTAALLEEDVRWQLQTTPLSRTRERGRG
jgi:hypothetical protein